MGFVYLDNFIGNGDMLYSAELTTCFDRCAWGVFTRYCAKFFLKKCFDEFGLYKIKAQIYSDNYRVKSLLKSSGFVHEATLKNETLRLGKPQNIEVYSLYRDYYYKTR
ncbi:MAG: GNAT family N-acetyltransferase [Muribaculaceae bacterium]|nr:GNAT family N-acetyltransferase [Muribaculaceae bacterium]